MQPILNTNQPTHKADTNNSVSAEQLNQLEQQKALTKVIAQIRESLDLDEIFNITAIKVRQLLNCDRVAIFRFEPHTNWDDGEFVAEDVDESWDSVLTKRIQDHCFGEKYAGEYGTGKVHAIADIHELELEDCYIRILTQFQIRANLIVPLLKGKLLWGLLCIHQCRNARVWQEHEIEFVKQIAEQLGVALQHSEMLMQAKWQIEQQKALTGVIARIRESLDLEEIFKITAVEVRQLLNTDRVAVFRFEPDSGWDDGEFVSEDVDESWDSVLAKRVHDHCFGEQYAVEYENGKVQAVADIHQANLKDCHVSILGQFQIRANLIVPLLKGKLLWGLLCIHQCSRPRVWEEREIGFVKQIAEQLGVALQQSDYLQQMQLQSAKLATAEQQQQIAERQKAIAATIDRIRQSLDIDTIFQTATQEVRQLLNVDRVVIYRFHADWSGEFVAESIGEGWLPLVGMSPLVEDTYLQETQGGRYANNETFAINDINSSGHSDCHLALLRQFQAQAYAIAPIFQGEHLWGLLATYQNSSPRDWQEHEINLLRQISWQLGVSLQQAEYLEQVEEKSNQLKKAAERQRALATTIEKIRRSLDIDVIFKTTTQEVRQLLEVERVAIYRFYSDWSGEFVADSIADDWTPLTKPQGISENRFLLESQGGQYPRNETFVPILQGEKLWGLLMAYQASQPRYWQEEEVNLLAQVGVQLGIALQQAELLQQTQQQAQELTQALEELQQSQIQLIQGEKLAGLGQLIAGIAHEINTPLGTIKTAGSNMGRALNDALAELPNFYQLLNSTEQKQFFDLLELTTQAPTILTSREKRSLKKAMKERLKSYDIEDISWMADQLIDIGIYGDEIKPFISLLKHDKYEFILELAYNLARLPSNNRTIEKAVGRVTKIVAALKNYARYDTSDQKDKAQIIEGLETSLELHSIQLKYDIDIVRNYQDIPPISCFADELIQVWTNLIHNGIQAMKGQGTLTISALLDEPDGVKIQITDSGEGISPEIQSQIFNPFFTTKPMGEGNGLGLHICHKIIDKHQGRIELESQPGQTTFTVWLPF